MRLFNTLTQRIEPLEPTGRRVTLYVCGITPYDTTHLGHAFINVVYDILVRYLRWRGLRRRATSRTSPTSTTTSCARRARSA